MEDRQLIREQTGHHIGEQCRHKGRPEDRRGKVPLHLFEDKDHARQGGIEGGRQSGPRPGRNQSLPLPWRHLEPLGDGRPHGSAWIGNSNGIFARCLWERTPGAPTTWMPHHILVPLFSSSSLLKYFACILLICTV